MRTHYRLLIVVALAIVGRAQAALPVAYTVDQTALRLAVAGTPVVFELHADAACSSLLQTQTISVEDVALIERVRRFKVRGAASAPRVARLSHVVASVPSSTAYFLKVSGTGISPVGGDCQPQSAPSNAGALPCASQVGTDVYFTGCNVNIRNGNGRSDGGQNCLGNLVIGYNENSGALARVGSHNAIIGPYHAYSSSVGLAVGLSHTLIGGAVSVTGGIENTANGFGATVAGGTSNVAGTRIGNPLESGLGSTVAGGTSNNAFGDFATVSGGAGNEAGGRAAAVSGGFSSEARGEYASVSGGQSNIADGNAASVCGGSRNEANGSFASVIGGECNIAGTAPGVYAPCIPSSGVWAPSVAGGAHNLASGGHATVGGGSHRTAAGEYDWAAGSLFQDF